LASFKTGLNKAKEFFSIKMGENIKENSNKIKWTEAVNSG